MNHTRRTVLVRLISSVGATSFMAGAPLRARACLLGKWKVRCPNGHDDIVDDVTCNHACETCHANALSGGVGNVVCPNGHASHVSTGDRNEQDKWLQSFKCPTCGFECRIDEA